MLKQNIIKYIGLKSNKLNNKITTKEQSYTKYIKELIEFVIKFKKTFEKAQIFIDRDVLYDISEPDLAYI